MGRGCIDQGDVKEFLANHPEVHCPVCGRRDFAADPLPVTVPHFGSTGPMSGSFPRCALSCLHCTNTLLFAATLTDGHWSIGLDKHPSRRRSP